MNIRFKFHNENQRVYINDNMNAPVTIESGIDILIENYGDNQEEPENYGFISLKGYEAEQFAHAILDAVKVSREINREFLEKHPEERN